MPTKAKATVVKISSSAAVEYEVLVGLNYGDRRAEEGEIVNDLPEESLGWLLEQSYVREVVEE